VPALEGLHQLKPIFDFDGCWASDLEVGGLTSVIFDRRADCGQEAYIKSICDEPGLSAEQQLNLIWSPLVVHITKLLQDRLELFTKAFLNST
jgi:hypothetical protein